jgi:HAMP domain-containing protein
MMERSLAIAAKTCAGDVSHRPDRGERLMAGTPKPPRDDDRSIADAAHLFRDEPARPSPTPSPRPGAVPSGEGYELEGPDPADIAPVAPPIPTTPIPEAEPSAPRRVRTAPTVEARVDQVWTRSAEWGPHLIVLAIVGLVVFFLFWNFLTVDTLGIAFLILIAGLAVLLVLSYPILITLERPVRITPEQAVKDYYGALSHHLPHYRRMWLLLSSAGRTSSAYGSFEGFKRYWKQRLAKLRGHRASSWTPLVFKIDDFKSEKSAGKTSIDAKFTVHIFIRGRANEGPIDSIKVETGLVRGPDNMWYLNKGTLPGERI